MKALEIKEKREKLGLTQEQLAKKVGVSKNTILNYEKGKIIPESKREILEQILNPENHNIVKEPVTTYNLIYNDADRKIDDLLEKIHEREQIMGLLGSDSPHTIHQQEIIKLLKIQVDLLKQAKTNKENDL